MTENLKPAEQRVFNIISAAAPAQLAEWEVQARHANEHGGYKGVSEALNSLALQGVLAREDKPKTYQPSKWFVQTEPWYSLPATTTAAQKPGTGSNADYRRDTVDLHNLGYII